MELATAGLADADDLSSITVTVFGLGKMGLPLAAVLADHGARVVGVDIDEETVTAVDDGHAPVSEPGLQALLDEYAETRLTATTDGQAAVADADVHIVLVPTLVDDASDPDLGPVLAAAKTIRGGVSAGDLVILESTVPPGTTAGPFAEAAEPDGLTAGEDFGVAHCPERTSSGRVIRDLTESYPKIVGGVSDAGTTAAASFYRQFNDPGVIEMPNATAAEAVKVFEGVYRDVNIALANELAKACEDWGLDAATVFEAANSQPFCDIHDPGVGVGGHCIPVYPHFVMNRAEETPLLATARAVNDGMPGHTADITASLVRGAGVDLADASVLVLGLTYRPGVDETRFAPAFDLVEALRDLDVTVAAHDPLLSAAEIESAGASPVTDPTDGTWDAVVLATGHEAYESLDLDALAGAMRTPILVDGRDFFDPADVTAFTYACIGDGTSEV
ncbi:nucleotide sugar dehydrogenase [Halorientalis pallida]|uniref:UDP-N-acetyl-D-mannosamine dehydrogenase n=1 Tax=Halorientalis pallida TaxID=2479928 RepID=A0A498L1J6_9EURY|nr:nucleotide sugar dehydrogenase [Halorientalis pallida]RXK47431.1 nucleotide sugar dehydrogenase [Halorientalis pallida]